MTGPTEPPSRRAPFEHLDGAATPCLEPAPRHMALAGGSPAAGGAVTSADVITLHPLRAQPPEPGEQDQLAECRDDLRRVKAEYDNYRKQVRRDRLAVGETATANVLHRLLPVLDALDRARTQGEVTGEFAAVAGALETQLASLGLQAFGAAGEPFDPVRHEAATATVSERVDRPTCTRLLRPGYRLGGRVLRPAQVEVTQPP